MPTFIHRFFRCLWVVTLAVASAAASASAAAAADLRVMSFNIRTGLANDGINSWNHPQAGVIDRKDLVVQTIENYDPDILGLQEDHDFQGNYIRDNTDGYSMFRRGVQADGDGEMVAILYKTDRFTRARQGTFWLSPNPGTAGSQYPNAEFARIVNWLELRDNQNDGLSFVIMNTHWEHGGSDLKDEVRLKSAALMRTKMTEIAPDLPIIFTGDFNADEGSDSYRRLTSRDDFVETPIDETRFLTDTYRNRHSDSESVGTAHGFDGTAGSGRIDWILHTDQEFNTVAADIDRTSFVDSTGAKRYPSDHFPINAIIRPVPEPGSAAVMVAAGTAIALARRRRRHT